MPFFEKRYKVIYYDKDWVNGEVNPKELKVKEFRYYETALAFMERMSFAVLIKGKILDINQEV